MAETLPLKIIFSLNKRKLLKVIALNSKGRREIQVKRRSKCWLN